MSPPSVLLPLAAAMREARYWRQKALGVRGRDLVCVKPGLDPRGAKEMAPEVTLYVGEAGGERTVRAGGGECMRFGEWPKSLRGGGERRRVFGGGGECILLPGGGGERSLLGEGAGDLRRFATERRLP